jgi:hypothetical protein
VGSLLRWSADARKNRSRRRQRESRRRTGDAVLTDDSRASLEISVLQQSAFGFDKRLARQVL